MIVPAILQSNKDILEEQIFQITRTPGVEKIQVDFCDGDFVPNKTLNISDFEVLNPAFVWEAHLMVSNPQDFLDYQIVGFKKIIIHYEAFDSESSIDDAITSIKKAGMVPGLALNLDTPVSSVRYFSDNVKDFLLMSVVPGQQGGTFEEYIFERIKQLRDMSPHGIIEVDGGVNETNIKQVMETGVDDMVVGSAIFGHGDVAKNFEHLSAIAK